MIWTFVGFQAQVKKLFISFGIIRDGSIEIEDLDMGDERFEIKKSTDGQFYFVLVAPNNEVIAKSEMYKSKDGCENGIRAVKEYTPTAFIVDKTA